MPIAEEIKEGKFRTLILKQDLIIRRRTPSSVGADDEAHIEFQMTKETRILPQRANQRVPAPGRLHGASCFSTAPLAATSRIRRVQGLSLLHLREIISQVLLSANNDRIQIFPVVIRDAGDIQ